jgi:purine nucleosidase
VIVDAASEENDLPMYVVCGGPLTNIASALELDPGIVERLTLVWVAATGRLGAWLYERCPSPPD